jgi:hypothetical protein
MEKKETLIVSFEDLECAINCASVPTFKLLLEPLNERIKQSKCTCFFDIFCWCPCTQIKKNLIIPALKMAKERNLDLIQKLLSDSYQLKSN